MKARFKLIGYLQACDGCCELSINSSIQCCKEFAVYLQENSKSYDWLKINQYKNQAFNKKLKSKLKNLLIILVLIIGTSISIRQYKNTYPDPSERKDLSVKGIFLD